MHSLELHHLSAASTRRDFLKKSMTGTLLLGSAGFLARCTGRQAEEGPRPTGFQVFNPQEVSTLSTFCEAVLPGPTEPAQAVPLRIDGEVIQWSAKNRSEVRSLLVLIEHGTRYFFFSWRAFSELALEKRRDYLHGWETSHLDFRRQAFQVLRMMALFFFYSQDATWKAIGYDGPWIRAMR
jgi:hypothetical protein